MSDEYHPIGSSFDLGRSLGNGLTAIRVALGPMWLGGLLMMIGDGGCSGTDLPTDWMNSKDDDLSVLHRWSDVTAAFARQHMREEVLGFVAGFVVAFVLAMFVIGVLMFALHCWVTTGFIRMHVNILEHASDDVQPLFTGKDRFWHMAGFKLLRGFGISAAMIVAAWPGLLVAFVGHLRDRPNLMGVGIVLAVVIAVPVGAFVGISLYLGEHVVALEGVRPVHALRRAWALAQGNRLPLLGFAVVMWLVQVASVFGIILCCIGLLATMPLAIALTGFAKTEGFLLFTRGYTHSDGWALWRRRAQEENMGDRVPSGPAAPGGPAGPVPASAAAPPDEPAKGPPGSDEPGGSQS